MRSILVNIEDLYKYNMDRVLEKIPIKYLNKNDNNYKGIIFIIPLLDFYNINKIQKGKERIEYMNSVKFINNINGIYYIIYNDKNKLCEIRKNINNQKHLKHVLNSITNYLPKNVTIWIGIIPYKNLTIYIKEGFNDVYKCNKSPLGFKFKKYGIAFIKKKDSGVLNNLSIKYLDIVDKKNILKCEIYARFTPDTLKYLNDINLTVYNKEISGSLYISNIIEKQHKIVFELSSNPKSIINGLEEEVNAVYSRYNFHTHPKKAYENYKVINGWPSSQDYIGFLDLKNTTIFHTVVTLEGVYIISLSSEWHDNISTNIPNRKYISHEYDINHLENITPEDYVNKINLKKYKGKQLFHVKYMDWNNAYKIFPVFYNKTRGECLVSDDTFNLSNLL